MDSVLTIGNYTGDLSNALVVPHITHFFRQDKRITINMTNGVAPCFLDFDKRGDAVKCLNKIKETVNDWYLMSAMRNGDTELLDKIVSENERLKRLLAEHGIEAEG